jgi:hypothetical protein
MMFSRGYVASLILVWLKRKSRDCARAPAIFRRKIRIFDENSGAGYGAD